VTEKQSTENTSAQGNSSENIASENLSFENFASENNWAQNTSTENTLAQNTLFAKTPVENTSAVKTWLERLAVIFLVLMCAAAPVSIAATQAAWLLGTACWLLTLFWKPTPKYRFGTLGLFLILFLIWSAVSSAVSYEPFVSLDKLRGVSVLLIYFFVVAVCKSRRILTAAVLALILSAAVAAITAPVSKLIGRGVEVHGLEDNGLLYSKGVREGDTLLSVNGKKIYTPEQLLSSLTQSSESIIEVYRTDAPFEINLSGQEIQAGSSAAESLGFTSWTRSSNFRAAGFYGHYTTFAEVIQLVASLALGLAVAFLLGKRKYPAWALIAFVLLCSLALVLSVTRASQIAFAVSTAVIAFFSLRRWLALALIAAGALSLLLGVYIVKTQRGVGVLDSGDGSIKYRQMMWRDGVRLWTASERNFIFGVGMDSIKKHWPEWGLFDRGWQPMGHFHSTVVQLLVERGLPALLIWLAILLIYLQQLIKGLKSMSGSDILGKGILLGSLGGLCGFFTSGLVHYNLGDAEVAMLFYILMGFSVVVIANGPASHQQQEHIPQTSKS
jgi:O-antigen ligase